MIHSFAEEISGIIDTVTTDASEIERRIRTYQKQLKTKQAEFEQLKERKSKEALRRQEEELKNQLQVILEIEFTFHQTRFFRPIINKSKVYVLNQHYRK